ncbi:leucine--tRNA ligase [Mycoplasmopsis edwardii]|uniref:Leucine--tRNA ligase n=1 Tax=Mycoplasmopsis edwardii TaxID=53558 RepID=A0ACD4PI73_9BACT|nr:leucine--tRNA ligase [Mycoplasmopsis edwardii]WBP84328.1 leucine--tRNA ligase [Mycoplasmopsis edwardii]
MYNHKKVEQKWQKIWEETHAFKTTDNKDKKFYALDMFPYPSASGLHVGHPEGYTATDIVSRFKRLNGFDVLHPIGWDAFGLPAEQYALKTGNHPAPFTQANIKTFKKQLKSLGMSFDWDKEVDTTDPKFYKWTQWIFKKLYEHGLAEIKEIDVNWCESLGTVLANEEVITDENGNRVSERGNFPVVRKPMKQWVLKITAYAEKLLEGLKDVEFSESLKTLQENWIGKSEGHVVKFQIENSDNFIEVFTTRIDTLFGVSFLVLAPEHELLSNIKSDQNLVEFLEYSKTLSDRDRISNNKEKIGTYTGVNVIHPITKKVLPVWTSNYVLNTYGTGAIMAVPAEDERDKDFAIRYNLPILEIIKDNQLINSGDFDGLEPSKAKKAIYEFLATKDLAKSEISYKIRDWIFSRQRYWGEPFPVYFDEQDNIYIEENIVELPYMENIKPSSTGESPLANNTEWLYFEKDGKRYKRETNTMPQWAGSSWYFLAYIIKNADGTYLDLDSKEAYQRFQKWLPVDLYIGGQEHAVGHLIYSRFWHKFLYDINVLPVSEPFIKVVNQGMILGPDGQKMSKSRGNVINPDEIVEEYGADTLRVYEMFMGPLTDTKEWSVDSIRGIRKWLDRVEVIISKFTNDSSLIDPNFKDSEFNSLWQSTIKDVTNAIETLKFNIAISKLMVFINGLYKVEKLSSTKPLIDFAIMLSTLAPHLAEELLEALKEKQIKDQSWPVVDEKLIQNTVIKLVVQVNGKVRAVIEKEGDLSEDEIFALALAQPNVQKFIDGNEIKRKQYIKDKIIIFNV